MEIGDAIQGEAMRNENIQASSCRKNPPIFQEFRAVWYGNDVCGLEPLALL